LILLVQQEAEGTELWIYVSIGIFVNAGILGVSLLIWWLSRRGFLVAYVAGMVFYAFDGLIFLLFGDVFGMVIHAFFLFMLWGGLAFVRQHALAKSILDSLDEENRDSSDVDDMANEPEPKLFGDDLLRDPR